MISQKSYWFANGKPAQSECDACGAVVDNGELMPNDYDQIVCSECIDKD